MSASAALRIALATAIPAVVLAVAPAHANVPESTLLSHTPSGGEPNAPAADAVMSGDGRQARYAAYTSKATNIANGANGARNLFLVKRRKPFGVTGTRWREADTRLVTRGRGGAANGDSSSPTFDGYDYKSGGREITVAPKCLAFVSRASNLVRGDSNGKRSDVFIRSLKTGKVKRLKGSGGATEVALDGQCNDIAYVAGGRPYIAQTNGKGRRRRAGSGGAKSLTLSANGETLTYERGGNVYVYVVGGGARNLGSGTHPSSEEWGRYVTFERGGRIFKGNLKGSFSPQPVRQTGSGLAEGTMPNMSAGGTFVAYAVGPVLALSGYNVPKGSCMPDEADGILDEHLGDVVDALEDIGITIPGLRPVARASAVLPSVLEPRQSAHGNYLVYSCEDGPAWMTYIGDFATGNPTR